MAGIVGIIRFDGGAVDLAQLRSMASALSHRGPDGSGEWIAGPVGLAQLALHTTAESLEEHQPVANEDKSVLLVMDGWLSNWEELRQELLTLGARLRDHSDAELVLHAYESWGEACLEHIDGDFAIAIWDGRAHRAFCARDRFGNKPFYYRWDDKALAFASELHAILGLAGVEPTLNDGMVVDIVADAFQSREETLWKGISRLVAAHRMVVTRFGPKSDRYWQPRVDGESPDRADDEYVEEFRGLFDDTVRRASRTHRPLACEVSGGLDSSLVFATADVLRRDGRISAPSLAGYTLSFAEDSGVDDLPYARALAEHLATPIREVAPSEMDPKWYLDWAAFYRDIPGYPNGFMSWAMRQASWKEGSRVVLTGAGGDEWMSGGGFALAEELRACRWTRLLALWMADRDALGLGPSISRFVRGGLLPLLPDWCRKPDRVLRSMMSSAVPGRRDWMTPDALRTFNRRRRASKSPTPRWARAGQRVVQQYLVSPFGVLARELEERMAARLGLELRHPYWSRRIVEFAFTMPDRLRRQGSLDRVLQRRAAGDRLPLSIATREGKASFDLIVHRAVHAVLASGPSGTSSIRGRWVTPAGWEALQSRVGPARPGPSPALWAVWNIAVGLLPAVSRSGPESVRLDMDKAGAGPRWAGGTE